MVISTLFAVYLNKQKSTFILLMIFRGSLNATYNMCHIFYNYNHSAKTPKLFKLNNNNTLKTQ